MTSSESSRDSQYEDDSFEEASLETSFKVIEDMLPLENHDEFNNNKTEIHELKYTQYYQDENDNDDTDVDDDSTGSDVNDHHEQHQPEQVEPPKRLVPSKQILKIQEFVKISTASVEKISMTQLSSPKTLISENSSNSSISSSSTIKATTPGRIISKTTQKQLESKSTKNEIEQQATPQSKKKSPLSFQQNYKKNKALYNEFIGYSNLISDCNSSIESTPELNCTDEMNHCDKHMDKKDRTNKKKEKCENYGTNKCNCRDCSNGAASDPREDELRLNLFNETARCLDNDAINNRDFQLQLREDQRSSTNANYNEDNDSDNDTGNHNHHRNPNDKRHLNDNYDDNQNENDNHNHNRKPSFQHSRRSLHFSNDRMREIERHNKILLKKIVSNYGASYTHTFSWRSSSNLNVLRQSTRTFVASATINRKNKQQQIDLDNQVLKKKLEVIASTRSSLIPRSSLN